MQPPSLLVVDLDGTLVLRDGSVHEDDVRAIARLRDAGVTVTIATGRTPAATLHVAESLGLGGPGVCTDGAMLIQLHDGLVLRHETLGAAPTRALQRAVAPLSHVALAVLVENTVILDDRASLLETVARAWSPTIERTDRVLGHRAWQRPDGITAAVVVGLRDEIAAVVAALASEPLAVTHFEVTRFEGLSSLIVHGHGVSKGAGLRWLAEHHQKTLEETVAVGDWLNDVPMLELAARSFAMAHAPERVKRAARHVLKATREGGAIAEIAALVWSL